VSSLWRILIILYPMRCEHGISLEFLRRYQGPRYGYGKDICGEA